MQVKKLVLGCIILMFLVSSVLTISVSSEDNMPPDWNKDWAYRQEIKLPISTENLFAKYQPIDIRVKFVRSCWAKDEKEHSIRVVCWDGYKWHELESQIYDLKYTDSYHIGRCDLVFLVPEIADGEERYFVYYDDDEKPSPRYIDHVSIEDAYYYLEPISGISLEADYYKITEDGYLVYVVGQKGQIYNRRFSQSIVKEKPGTKEFDMLNSDQGAAFSFSYFHGVEDEDEISSDQVLVSKDICVDGNLMVEFGIVSESSGKDLRTTNIYKYYYCPTKEKRICVHVKHEVLDKGVVTGIENADGRYGTLGSLKSRSARVEKMRFGEIPPYLHVYGENDYIREYRMNVDPESKEREWVISYSDDCDLGKDAWISYDEGESGKAHAILFSSNEDIVKYGTDERDGIQLKVVEREYLDIVGTEVDYTAINFGRNSYEKGSIHDVDIPGDLVVEFDAEFFTAEEGSYKDVIEEGKIYRTLVKHRHKSEKGLFEGDQNIHTLTVIPRLSGRISSYPWLVNITGGALPVTWVELYYDNTLVSSGVVTKPLLGVPRKKFPKLAPGEYVVRAYRKIGDNVKNYIGVEPVKIEGDTTLHIYCTWQKSIELNIHNQHGEGIKDVELILSKGDTVVIRNVTSDIGMTILYAPFNLFDSYVLEAFYKGFIIYAKEVPMMKKKVDINLDIYDLTVEINDELGLCPGVDVRPFLTSLEMDNPLRITPVDIGHGKYIFGDLPAATYELQISYGSFFDIKTIDVPEISDTSIRFTAIFDISTELFDIRGDPIQDDNQRMDIIRNGRIIYESVEPDKIVSIPPGKYTINVYSDGRLIGFKNIELMSNRNIKIVTTEEPILPIVVTGLVLVFIGEIVVLLLFKKISLNTFLKLMAMTLILLSLFQPWWVLNASSNYPAAEKNTEMFILPQTMIDSVTYEDKTYLDLATVPELFTEFLGVLLLVVCLGFVLLGVSFIPNIFLKRRFSLILISASILFLILIAATFSFGMSKICEISIGSLQGGGTLDIVLPSGETVIMSSSWGLGSGFYLCIISALAALAAGILDCLRRESWPKHFLTKK